MNIKKVKALKYSQVYIDNLRLSEGLYAGVVPFLKPVEETIETLSDKWERILSGSPVSDPAQQKEREKMIEALKQCTLEPEFLIDAKAVEFIGEALNAYFHAGLDKLHTKTLGDLEKSNLEYQVATSKELLKLFELTK